MIATSVKISILYLIQSKEAKTKYWYKLILEHEGSTNYVQRNT